MSYTPTLRKEVVAAEPLGEVVVRMLKLSERLALSDADAKANTYVPRLLAIAVATKEGAPVFDAEGWDIFAADHPAMAGTLVDAALRLSGLGGDAAAKNG